jgi:hypothetical protein
MRHRLFLSNQSFCFRDIHRLVMTILQSLSFLVATADAENPAKTTECMANRFEHEVAIASSGIIGK